MLSLSVLLMTSSACATQYGGRTALRSRKYTGSRGRKHWAGQPRFPLWIAPRSRSHAVTSLRPARSAISSGVCPDHGAAQLRSAPRSSRYCAAASCPPWQAFQNDPESVSASGAGSVSNRASSQALFRVRFVPQTCLCATLDQPSRRLPLAVAGRRGQRRAAIDRRAVVLDVGAGVDQRAASSLLAAQCSGVSRCHIATAAASRFAPTEASVCTIAAASGL